MSLEDAIRENTLSNERMQDSIERQEHEKIKNPYEILFRVTQIFTIVFVSSLLWGYDFFFIFPNITRNLIYYNAKYESSICICIFYLRNTTSIFNLL